MARSLHLRFHHAVIADKLERTVADDALRVRVEDPRRHQVQRVLAASWVVDRVTSVGATLARAAYSIALIRPAASTSRLPAQLLHAILAIETCSLHSTPHLCSCDEVILLRQDVDQLAFAFIAPL